MAQSSGDSEEQCAALLMSARPRKFCPHRIEMEICHIFVYNRVRGNEGIDSARREWLDRELQRKLILGIRSGNTNAFKDLRNHLAPRLMGLLKAKFGLTGLEAEDILNDAVEDVILHIDSFDDSRSSLKTYFSKITINKATNYIKRRKSVRTVPLTYEPRGTTNNPGSIYSKHFAFYQALRMLPPKCRETIEFMLTDISSKKTARLLGITVDAYRQRKRRTLKRLKEIVKSFPEFQDLF